MLPASFVRLARIQNQSLLTAPSHTVLWAQRSSSTDPEKNFVYVTISVPDVPASNLKLELKPTGLTFTGHSDTLKKTYHLELELFAEIDDKASQVHHTGKNVELKLQKKELNEEFWPRLLKDKKKVHFLRTDFDKWVDEDEQNEAADEDFSQFGGMGKFSSSHGWLSCCSRIMSFLSSPKQHMLRHPNSSSTDIFLYLQLACLAWVVRYNSIPDLHHKPRTYSACALWTYSAS